MANPDLAQDVQAVIKQVAHPCRPVGLAHPRGEREQLTLDLHGPADALDAG